MTIYNSIYITLKDGHVSSLGSRAPRATYYIPLEPSGPQDSREPGATRARARARARREKLDMVAKLKLNMVANLKV